MARRNIRIGPMTQFCTSERPRILQSRKTSPSSSYLPWPAAGTSSGSARWRWGCWSCRPGSGPRNPGWTGHAADAHADRHGEEDPHGEVAVEEGEPLARDCRRHLMLRLAGQRDHTVYIDDRLSSTSIDRVTRQPARGGSCVNEAAAGRAAGFAVFSDVHGNSPALEPVPADIKARGVTNVSCLGDLVGYGPFPDEVAQRVATPASPPGDGQSPPGHPNFQTGDCGCGLQVIGTSSGPREPPHRPGQYAAPTSETRAFLRKPARWPHPGAWAAGELPAVQWQSAAHQRVPFLSAPAVHGHEEDGPARWRTRAILFGHMHAPDAAAPGELHPAFVNVGSAGRPRMATGVRATPSSTLTGSAAVGRMTSAGLPVRARPSSSCASPYDYERLVAGLAATPLITSTYAGPPRT